MPPTLRVVLNDTTLHRGLKDVKSLKKGSPGFANHAAAMDQARCFIQVSQRRRHKMIAELHVLESD